MSGVALSFSRFLLALSHRPLPPSSSLVPAALLLPLLAPACADEPVAAPSSPGPPPPAPEAPSSAASAEAAEEDEARTRLIAEVRELADDLKLSPLTPPPPVRAELVELGRSLAFDKVLSGGRDVSCMTCHLPGTFTGDGRSLPIGPRASGLGPERINLHGETTLRHSMALFNLHRVRKFLWGGEIEALSEGGISTPAGYHLTEEMKEVFEFGESGISSAPALFPVSAPEEMLGTRNELAEAFGEDHDFTALWSGLMARLGRVAEYRNLFETAYPGVAFDDMSFAHASNAIMGFMISSFSHYDAPWDRFLRGADDALTDTQLEGARAFMTVGCTGCHQTDIFDALPGNEFHNDALAQFGPGKGDGPSGLDDFGRERVTGDPADRRRFRTPPLRNIELTAPYGHVGQFVTLRGFVEHYDDVDRRLREYEVEVVPSNLRPVPLDNVEEILANRDELLIPIRLDEATVTLLVEFLGALTADSARDLAHVTPDRVPSGLPVDRLEH